MLGGVLPSPDEWLFDTVQYLTAKNEIDKKVRLGLGFRFKVEGFRLGVALAGAPDEWPFDTVKCLAAKTEIGNKVAGFLVSGLRFRVRV